MPGSTWTHSLLLALLLVFQTPRAHGEDAKDRELAADRSEGKQLGSTDHPKAAAGENRGVDSSSPNQNQIGPPSPPLLVTPASPERHPRRGIYAFPMIGPRRYIPQPRLLTNPPVLHPSRRVESSLAPKTDTITAERTGEDRTRSERLVVLGDRLFRGGKLSHAEGRYNQAAELSPGLAEPRLRLAMIALVRKLYSEAAGRLREAQIVEPGWMRDSLDIQSIFAEPGDFARHIGQIESHVLAYPEDRDAWLVLGSQYFLSGRTDRAFDIFVRLDDGESERDAILIAFLEATRERQRSRSNDPIGSGRRSTELVHPKPTSPGRERPR